MPPRINSPRFQLVRAHSAELFQHAASAGAPGICLVGSVATGLDRDALGDDPGSDIDFYIPAFPDQFNGEGTLERSQRLEAAFEALLPEYKIEICGTPQRPVDAVFGETMKRDAIPLTELH